MQNKVREREEAEEQDIVNSESRTTPQIMQPTIVQPEDRTEGS